MEVSEYLMNEISSTRASFFLSPRGELVPSGTKHISAIIKNPRKFGLTRKEINDIYGKHNETIGTEGDAREEIIEKLLKRGWVRLRRYPNRYWSVTIYRMSRKLKDLLKDWANKMLEGALDFKENDPYMPVRIVSPITTYSKKTTISELAETGIYESDEYKKQIYHLILIESVEGLPDMLIETSLTRILKHNEDHDCGIITAFRNYEGCGQGKELSKKDNMKRNKSLALKLKSRGYGVTRIMGKYPEGGKEKKEIGYFVVDLNDRGNLEQYLIELGKEFNQDSILFIPKGSILGEKRAYLIGTNRCDNNWLGYGKKLEFPRAHFDKESIYTTVVGGKRFVFEDESLEIPDTATGFGKWALDVLSRKNWEELEYEPDSIFEMDEVI